MTCGDKFNKNCPTGGTRVDPTEVEGRPLCNRADCGRRVVGDGSYCSRGHPQADQDTPSVGTPPELEGVLAAVQELIATDPRWANDPRVQALVEFDAVRVARQYANSFAIGQAVLRFATTIFDDVGNAAWDDDARIQAARGVLAEMPPSDTATAVRSWTVPSDSRDRDHTVLLLDDGSYKCTCEDCTYRERDCHHIRDVRQGYYGAGLALAVEGAPAEERAIAAGEPAWEWEAESDLRPDVVHHITRHGDGSLHCDCEDFIYRREGKADETLAGCKHTRRQKEDNYYGAGQPVYASAVREGDSNRWLVAGVGDAVEQVKVDAHGPKSCTCRYWREVGQFEDHACWHMEKTRQAMQEAEAAEPQRQWLYSWTVPSRSREEKTHTVELAADGTYRCDCEDYQYRVSGRFGPKTKDACEHMRQVQVGQRGAGAPIPVEEWEVPAHAHAGHHTVTQLADGTYLCNCEWSRWPARRAQKDCWHIREVKERAWPSVREGTFPRPQFRADGRVRSVQVRTRDDAGRAREIVLPKCPTADQHFMATMSYDLLQAGVPWGMVRQQLQLPGTVRRDDVVEYVRTVGRKVRRGKGFVVEPVAANDGLRLTAAAPRPVASPQVQRALTEAQATLVAALQATYIEDRDVADGGPVDIKTRGDAELVAERLAFKYAERYGVPPDESEAMRQELVRVAGQTYR